MRKFLFSLVLILTLLPCVGSAQTVGNSEAKTAYGLLAFDEEDIYRIYSVVSFPVTGGITSFDSAYPFSQPTTAGAYADGYYYAVVTASYTDVTPSSLVQIDLENQTDKAIGSISGLPNLVNDMTYDNTAKVMYAISRPDDTHSALYTVNLSTGAFTKVVDLDQKYYTLACSYAGQLYAISSQGDFCKIDKTTGESTLINSVDGLLNGFQSMEFDHSDKTLYWAASLQMSNGDLGSFMATVDVNTGEMNRMGDLGTEAQIAGLYIPFVASGDDTPSGATQFSVTPGAQGGNTAAIQWKNPTQTFGGESMTSLTRVALYRDEQLIYSVDNPIVGATQSYTDELSQAGTYTYKVVATNNAGEGVPVTITTFVGADCPAAVEALNLQRDAYNTATLTWNAPVKGANGGWFDASSLVYKVVRQPGDAVLTDDLASLTYTDVVEGTPQPYYYEVYAVNTAGESSVASSVKVSLGDYHTIPYACNFATDELAGTWSVYDLNGDGVTWYHPESPYDTKNMTLKGNWEGNANDWLVSHEFQLTAGKSYKFGFKLYSATANDFKVYIVKDNDPAQVVKEVKSIPQLQSYVAQAYEELFEIEESGAYNLAFQLLSAPPVWGSTTVQVQDVTLDVIAECNLSASAITGNRRPKVGRAAQYDVTVTNKGGFDQGKFALFLKDSADNSTLAQTIIMTEIPSGESMSFAMEWTPTEEQLSVTRIYGEVVFQDDEVAGDNASPFMEVSVQDLDSPDFVQIGKPSVDVVTEYPFSLYEAKSASLNIYSAAEVGEGGKILEISYDLSSKWYDMNDIPVVVYMGNTTQNSVDTWIPESELTKVFEGNVNFPLGDNEVGIKLDVPFEYTGDNLAILTTHDAPDYTGKGNMRFPCYTSPLEGNAALIWDATKGAGFNFSQEATRASYNSSVNLYIQRGAIDGIDEVETDSVNVVPVEYYTIDGRRYAQPQRGINLVKMSDGTVKKVIVKSRD